MCAGVEFDNRGVMHPHGVMDRESAQQELFRPCCCEFSHRSATSRQVTTHRKTRISRCVRWQKLPVGRICLKHCSVGNPGVDFPISLYETKTTRVSIVPFLMCHTLFRPHPNCGVIFQGSCERHRGQVSGLECGTMDHILGPSGELCS